MWPCLTATWSSWEWEELRPGLQRAVAQAVRSVLKKNASCRFLPFGFSFFKKQKLPLPPAMLLSHSLFHPLSGCSLLFLLSPCSTITDLSPLKGPSLLFPPDHFSTLSLHFPLPHHAVLQQCAATPPLAGDAGAVVGSARCSSSGLAFSSALYLCSGALGSICHVKSLF